MRIIKAVKAHVLAKDALKAIQAEKERREAEARALELAKIDAEIEKLSAEVKLSLATKIATMNEEQLAAYNRTLIEAQRPPRYYPVYLPMYQPYPLYDLQTQLLQRRW